MKRSAWLLLGILAACGDAPSAPTAPPSPSPSLPPVIVDPPPTPRPLNMAFRLNTVGVSQSIGSATFSGSWAGGTSDCNKDINFEWGYEAFNNQTPFEPGVSVLPSSGDYSEGVSINVDRQAKFRAKGTDLCSGTTAQGANFQFKTYANAAAWGTPSASSITSNSALVSALYTPNTVESSAATSVFYRVQGVGGYTELAVQSGLTGSSAIAQSITIGSLSPGVTYEYYFRGTRNTANLQILDSSIGTFTTVTSPPTITTDAASSVGQKSATLNGTVDPNGGASYKFEYGLTVAYGTSTAVQGPSSATEPFAFSAAISGLALNTLYHFRAVASNGDTVVNGADQTFTTLPAQTATTLSPFEVTAGGATLRGSVSAVNSGNSVSFRIEYGLTTSYGTLTATQGPTSTTGEHPFLAAISGLVPNTLYHYRTVSFTSEHTVNGDDQTFTTLEGDKITLRI